MKNEKQIKLEFVEVKKPIEMSFIAQAIAEMIKKEGLNNERRSKIS